MTDSAGLRDTAREILSQDRFHSRRTPGPFRGVLRGLGDVLEPVGRLVAPVGRFLGRFGWLWENVATRVVLVVVVAAVVGALSLVVIRRRSAVGLTRGASRHGGARDDPAALERQADEAEARGDYGAGVRLRFRAGVIRLQDSGRVRRGRTTATRAIGRQLGSDAFDHLGEKFDEVAYGGRAATPDDAATARHAWKRVLSESSS